MNNTERKRLSWEITALRLAHNIADYRSPDPFLQVGACALKKDGNSVVLGYNGAPPGIEIDWTDRDRRRPRVIHAEANVLNRILPNEVEFIAITHLPCCDCLKIIAQKGIKKVIYSNEAVNYNNDLVKQLAKEFNIELKQISL
jgi:dCMP deaminase